MQSDWLRAFSHLTQEPDFSQTCCFNRIMKVIMVHDLNPKNLSINRLFFFLQNLKNPIFGVYLGIIPKIRFFHKNLAPSNFYPLGTITPWEVSEKSYELFWRKRIYLLTYWQWWNYRIPFLLQAGVQKTINQCSWCSKQSNLKLKFENRQNLERNCQ